MKKGIRIIGGTSRGKRLQAVRGRGIRPTSNRVRESIFNILSPVVAGSSVLDLFAGTGALGLEALSRGAERAVFIDNHRASVAAIKANMTACGVSDRAFVILWDIVKNLKCLHHVKPVFDLVFMDPPYGRQSVVPVLYNLSESGFLKRESLVVIEHSRHEEIPSETLGFSLSDQRKYGKSLVSFLRCVVSTGQKSDIEPAPQKRKRNHTWKEPLSTPDPSTR